MTDLKDQYKSTLVALGGTMLIWALLFNMFFGGVAALDVFLSFIPNESAVEIISSVVYDLAYLGAFMLPVAFFGLISRGKRVEPMRFDIKPAKDAWLWIIGGVTCAYSFSLVNAIMMTFIELPDGSGIINEATAYMSDQSLILQFITIALVPAFCEEFLFRGLILSNLMPYGKGLAIIISSVLFGLMHGNFYQFLYTTVAGIILGIIYVVTDSIWCAVFMHMINNALSILQTALFERFSEDTAYLIWIVIEGIIFFAGLICIVVLVVKYGQRRSNGTREVLCTFGKTCNSEEVYPSGVALSLTHKDIVMGFFNPAIIVYIAYALFSAVSVLLLA